MVVPAVSLVALEEAFAPPVAGVDVVALIVSWLRVRRSPSCFVSIGQLEYHIGLTAVEASNARLQDEILVQRQMNFLSAELFRGNLGPSQFRHLVSMCTSIPESEAGAGPAVRKKDVY